MVSIDEVIKEHRDRCAFYLARETQCNELGQHEMAIEVSKYADKHNTIANWLEEYKALKGKEE